MNGDENLVQVFIQNLSSLGGKAWRGGGGRKITCRLSSLDNLGEAVHFIRGMEDPMNDLMFAIRARNGRKSLEFIIIRFGKASPRRGYTHTGFVVEIDLKRLTAEKMDHAVKILCEERDRLVNGYILKAFYEKRIATPPSVFVYSDHQEFEGCPRPKYIAYLDVGMDEPNEHLDENSEIIDGMIKSVKRIWEEEI